MYHVEIKEEILYPPLANSDRVWIRLLSIPGVPHSFGAVVKMRKLLHKRHQAPTLWYEQLVESLKNIYLCQYQYTDLMIICTDHRRKVCKLLYVDEMFYIGDHRALQGLNYRLSGLLRPRTSAFLRISSGSR